MAKKNTGKTTVAKKVEEVKATPVAAKAVEVKEVVKETAKAAVAEVKKEAPKAAEKAAEKVASAKKAVKTVAKKAPAKKSEIKASVSVQFSGKSYTTEELVDIAKKVWRYDLKQKVADFKKVELYVKPEEQQAYYVINDKFSGSFFI